jgi:hypothetical protein
VRHLFATSAVPDDQMSRALARVHRRIRRRRNTLRGAGAAVMACVVLAGMGVAAQSDGSAPRVGIDAMEGGGSSGEVAPPEEEGICGHALADAEMVELDLTIQGSVEWPAELPGLGVSSRVSVEARNRSSRPLEIWLPVRLVGVTDEGFVDTEPSTPDALPTLVTLEPSETIELTAALPEKACSGDLLQKGSYTLAPIVQTEDLGERKVVVRGAPTEAVHR